MEIVEQIPGMREKLERHRAGIVELARRIGVIKEGLLQMSNFLEIRSMVGRHEAEMAGLRYARLDTPSPSLSRGPDGSSRLPVPIDYGDRNTLLNFLKLFRTWTLAHDAKNAIAAYELVRVVGKNRDDLDNAHRRQKVN